MSEAAHPPGTAPRNPDVRHERTDANVRGILITAALMVAGAIVIHLAVWGVFDGFEAVERTSRPPSLPLSVEERGRLPPEPILEGLKPLQSRTGKVVADQRADAEARLASYGWVDRKEGIAHIPIERAMETIASKGLPPAKPAEGGKR